MHALQILAEVRKTLLGRSGGMPTIRWAAISFISVVFPAPLWPAIQVFEALLPSLPRRTGSSCASPASYPSKEETKQLAHFSFSKRCPAPYMSKRFSTLSLRWLGAGVAHSASPDSISSS